MNQLFLTTLTDHYFDCDKNTYHHLFTVHRTRVGESLAIVTTQYRYIITITEIEKTKVFYKIIEQVELQLSYPEFVLFQSLPKQDKMTTIIDYAVQLGVTEIYPIVTNRTVVKWDGKKEQKNRERWQVKAESAACQSKQDRVPHVHELSPLKHIASLIQSSQCDEVIVFWEEQPTTDTIFKHSKRADISKIGCVIGPEGGLDQTEIKLLESAGCQIASLGAGVLRVEIASCVALTQLKIQYT